MHAVARYVSGSGLADSDQTERLWSYLRKCGKISKEMTPSQSIDTQTYALLHYAKKVREKQREYETEHEVNIW